MSLTHDTYHCMSQMIFHWCMYTCTYMYIHVRIVFCSKERWSNGFIKKLWPRKTRQVRKIIGFEYPTYICNAHSTWTCMYTSLPSLFYPGEIINAKQWNHWSANPWRVTVSIACNSIAIQASHCSLATLTSIQSSIRLGLKSSISHALLPITL